MNKFIINFTVCKSNRKNSKVKFVDILHFDTTTEERDIEKISDAVEKIIGTTQELQGKQRANFIFSAYLSTDSNASYINANDAMYPDANRIRLATSKQEFHSVEQMINFVYNCYMMCNQNSTLSIKTLYENSSIKYHINRYYNGEFAFCGME